MTQDFRVLQCSKCATFQVCQVRKAKKWQCKCCSTRQSVLKVFKEGTARDLRTVVQKMNLEYEKNIDSNFTIEQTNKLIASLRKSIDGAGVAEAMSQVDIDKLNSFLLFGPPRDDPEKSAWCPEKTQDQCTSQQYLDEIFGSDQFIEESAKTDKKKQSKWNDYVENTKQ